MRFSITASAFLVAIVAQAADPALDSARAKMVEELAALRFDALGSPQLRWDAIPKVRAGRERPHKQLVLLVEYADRGFERFKGEVDQGKRLAAFFQEQLFDERYERKDTLSHYYATQSLGAYHVLGEVLPPVRLQAKRSLYGGPNRPEGGDWRNDVDPEAMVTEALALAVAAHPTRDWSAFDLWDPTDFDGDGQIDEPDGYVDHLVLIYAGNGQSSCQALYKLDDALNPNVGNPAIEGLSVGARECADRIWPHRSMLKMNEGQGPAVEGHVHANGGVPLAATAGAEAALWARDYNAQSEYTDPATLIHEFGHSIGLPDIYARTSSNSTGGWEVMSGTTSPSPQNLSAWSRMMLGWLTPRVVVPPEYGGKKLQSAYLQTLDDPSDASDARDAADGLTRAVLVVLPPKSRELKLTTLPKAAGTLALYSGQGNELNRSAELRVDLRSAAGKVELSFDAWWDIEGGWDFAYVESSPDGRQWTRLLPTNRRFMPAKHGHDGPTTLPGFTGLSGDLDGDGKNESQKRCNPKAKVAYGEDRATAAADPCLEPSWVRVAFDLSALVGQLTRLRVRYATDMAAVQRGLLIDNVSLEAAGVREAFEGRVGPQWRLDGFTQSPGHHTVLVPHYYLLEFRDPYTEAATHRYDRALGEPFYQVLSAEAGAATLVQLRPRPGVVAWYYDGSYAWSENDPATNGPGHGVLLTVDANPNELSLPGLEALLGGSPETFDTGYDVSSEAAQKQLAAAFYPVVCFARNAPMRPLDVDAAALSACPAEAAAGAVKAGGKPLLYSYEVNDRYLPGPDRDAFQKLGELLDYKVREGVLSYRLRDRGLRHAHTYDAPFSLAAFADGMQVFATRDGGLERRETRSFEPVSAFSDGTKARWLNPKLPFGGVDIPPEGFGFFLTSPKAGAPKAARVKVWLTWDR